MQKFSEEFTGEELKDLIMSLGAAKSISYMYEKFNKPFTATIRSYLYRKNCSDSERHAEGVISSSWLELQKDFVKYSKGEKKSEYTSPYGFLVAVGINLSKKHLRNDIEKDRFFCSLSPGEEIFNDEIDHLICKNNNFDIFRAMNENSPEALFRAKEFLEYIDAYILQFPQIQQAAFNLFYYENYSHKQIGELLRMSESNSRAHISRIIKKIRPEIKKVYGGLR